MAATRCITCNHPDRTKIEAKLAIMSCAAVATEYKIRYQALYNHKCEHMSRSVARAIARRQAAGADQFLDRLESVYREAHEGYELAKADRHYPGMVGMLGQKHRNIELVGRATGRLVERQNPTQQVIVLAPGMSVSTGTVEQPTPALPEPAIIDLVR